MKITDVVALQLRISEVENIFDGTQDVLIVRVDTDEGISGIGEVVSSSFVARAVIEAPCSGGGRHGLREIVRGLDPTDTEQVWEAMYEGTAWYGRGAVAGHAMAGVDVALWDIKGKAVGRPTYQLLASTWTSRIRAYASVLWGDTIDETEALAQEFRSLGFRAVKFGFGPIGTSLEQDVAMVRTARQALGEENELMVDVGRRWSLDRAIAACAVLEPFRVGWIEEPLHPDDLEGYARLTATVDTPIAAAETETTVAGFRAFLDAGVRVIQPDLGRVGLTQGMKIARLAAERGARCVPHCFGTGVNTAASIHWTAAIGGSLVEYPMRTNALCRTLAKGTPQLQDGYVALSDRPGLGVELEEEVVALYRFTSPWPVYASRPTTQPAPTGIEPGRLRNR